MHSWEERAGILAESTGRPLAAPVTGVAELFDPAVAHPAVGDDGGTGFDVLGDERMQAGGRGVGEDPHVGAAVTTRFVDLDRHCHQGFLALGSSTSKSGFLAADEDLVDLHCTS